jgi:hypothetical protein
VVKFIDKVAKYRAYKLRLFMTDATSTVSAHTNYIIRERWSSSIDDGFTAIPNVLLKHQQDLEITCNELCVLIHVIMFWWDADQGPYPSAGTIAKRMGSSTRSVERHLASLSEKALLVKVKSDDRKRFDLSGLVKRLEGFAALSEHRRVHKYPVEESGLSPN